MYFSIKKEQIKYNSFQWKAKRIQAMSLQGKAWISLFEVVD